MINKNELPKNWEWVKMEDVCNKIGDIDHKMPKQISDGYPYVSTKDFTDDLRISFEKAKYISEEDFLRLSRKIKPEKGDIIFPRYGTIGKNILINFDKEFLVSYSCAILKPNLDLVLSKFLYLYSLSPRITDEIRKYVVETTQANIGVASIKSFVFPLPPLAEQERIVAKIEELFSELDAGIESLKTAQAQLKTYRQAVLKYAFEGKLTNENVNEGELPNGWKWVRLETLGELGRGKSKHRPRNEKRLFGGKYPFIQTGEVKAAGHVIKSFDKTYSDFGLAQSKLWKKGTLCITIAANIAETAFLGFDGCFPDSIVGFTANQSLVNPEYVFYFFKANQTRLESFAPATAQKNINLNTLENLILPLCPHEEQQRIVEEIESRLSVCDKLEETIAASLKQSEALRQSILKKAFEGKLVKPKEIEKPKRTAFYQMQTLGLIINRSKQKRIYHGEMTLAKYAFLADKIYDVPIYENYERWHLGPYSPEIKKTINNRTYFTTANNVVKVLNEEKLFKYRNEHKEQIEIAIDELSDIFSKYKDNERSHKIELLATVCKVIEDIQTTEITEVRQSMTEWKIDLKDKRFKNKAEKFSESETAKCVEFIIKKGWDAKLIA
jgi:type I restriction enzyme, S subunit